jgi:carbon monoxide dehydrogenase subunit G
LGDVVRLEHQFSVNAPVDVVWRALLDPEKVAPCMPGATLTSVDGTDFAGNVKVKLGPISLQYKGSGSFVEADADARVLRIHAAGKDARGNGTAAADVVVTLSERDGSTVGAVVTDLAITGRPAQFGRGLIGEVGGRILDTFAKNLAAQLEPETPSEKPDPPPAEEVDLLAYAGSPVVKRVAPVILVGLVVLILLSRRRRK